MRPVDLSRPFDVEIALKASENVRVKGLFFSRYVEELAQLGESWPTRLVPFKDYPARQFVELVAKLAKLKSPHKPLRETWHAIAASQYPTMRETLIGRVVFGMVGNDILNLLKVAEKGYSIASNAGRVRVVEAKKGYVLADVRGQGLPIEGWHSGIWAGLIVSSGARVTSIGVDLSDEGNGLLELHWG